MQTRRVAVLWIVVVLLVALTGAAVQAQQASTPDIWQMAPSNSLLVAVFDGRADNPSVKALAAADTPEGRELRAKQREALRKAVENLATLFGVRLDFAKDVDTWADKQSALVLVPEEGGGMQSVIMIASTDAAAADATLQKLAAPWQRVGELASETDADCPVTAFRMPKKGIEIYASACKSILAVSTSKTALSQVLKGGGFAAGSPGDKVLKTLSGSLVYAFADPALLKQFRVGADAIPISGLGLGISAIDTGIRIRAVGLPNEVAATFLKQAFPGGSQGALAANPGIPAGSLAAATLPSLKGAAGLAMLFGLGKNPLFDAALTVSDTQISAAMTAALPTPAGVASAMAESDEAAAQKLAEVAASLKKVKKLTVRRANLPGMDATAISIGRGRTLYLAQSGKHVILATDKLALTDAAATAKGEQPSLLDQATYQETMAGLGESNLLTLYVNLAPTQGVGYLIEGIGLGQAIPLLGSLAKGLENMQALGVGAGFDGEMASATLFMRCRPGIGVGSAGVGAAVGAAVMFPVIARARDSARTAACVSKMRELAVAAHMYAADHGGKLPTAAAWRTQLSRYIKMESIGECCPGGGFCAFNRNLSGVSLSKIKSPERVVMFFESDYQLPNAVGSRHDVALMHRGRACLAFADGHAQMVYQVPAAAQWLPYPAPKPVKKAPVKKAPAGSRHRAR